MINQNLSEIANGDTKHGAIRKADQDGTTIYPVFPGIEFAFVNVHDRQIVRERKTGNDHILEITYCREGRSEFNILFGNLLLFTAVFSVLGFALKNVLGLDDFLTAFWFFLALGEGLGLFDLVIIDLLWWRNTKRIVNDETSCKDRNKKELRERADML